MVGDPGDSVERRWLIEPPGPQEMHLQITSGAEVEMTPEIQEAFERLLAALSTTDEVQGYACAGYTKGCTADNFACAPRGKCTWEVQQPCFIDYQCKIAN
jgi:hypothetical protein